MSGSTRRTIPPLVDDPRAVHLTLAQRHTLALLPLALDDHGRTLDDAGRINGVLWGSLWRDHGPDDLDADLAALEAAGLVARYVVDGARYLQMLDWDAQQVISRRSPSRYPAPPAGTRSRPSGSGRGPVGDSGPDWVWGSIDALVDYVAGASEKLHAPAVQARAVSFLADLAAQLDPTLSAAVRERASTWVGSVAYMPTRPTVVPDPDPDHDDDDDAADIGDGGVPGDAEVDVEDDVVDGASDDGAPGEEKSSLPPTGPWQPGATPTAGGGG